MFMQDLVLNGQGVGPVGETLNHVRFESGLLRPFLISRGGRNIPCATINVGRNPNTGAPVYKSYTREALERRGIYSPVFNATSLRKEEWIQLDQVVLRAARYRLRAWADLAAANSYGGFNGMSKTILEHETMTDPGEAIVDMDGVSDGRSDAPQYQLEGLPLPITHSDFNISSRRLAASRNTGTPIDTTMGEASARRVAESIEKTTIGVSTGLTYGGTLTQSGGYSRNSSVYGYLNFPKRITYTSLHDPSKAGWTASTTLADVLYLRQLLYASKFYGPFVIYHSNDWDTYMDNDYILTGGNVATQTLRNRLKSIEGIQDVRRLDFLFGSTPDSSKGPGGDVDISLKPFTLIIVQMTPDVCRAVNGMDVTTVQWEEKGGLRVCFKVMAIQVPQLRADNYGNCGILVATTS